MLHHDDLLDAVVTDKFADLLHNFISLVGGDEQRYLIPFSYNYTGCLSWAAALRIFNVILLNLLAWWSTMTNVLKYFLAIDDILISLVFEILYVLIRSVCGVYKLLIIYIIQILSFLVSWVEVTREVVLILHDRHRVGLLAKVEGLMMVRGSGGGGKVVLLVEATMLVSLKLLLDEGQLLNLWTLTILQLWAGGQ